MGALAQGKVNWSSISASFVTAQTNAQTYSPLFGAGSTGAGTVGATAGTADGFYYALLFNGVSVPASGVGVAQPTTLAGLAAWNDTGLKGMNNTTAGRLSVTGTTGTSVTVPWAVGVTQNVMLVGWSANLGSTWSAALTSLNSLNFVGNGFFGMSTTGYIAAGSADPGTAVFGSSDAGAGLPIRSLLTQLYLVPVPEPSTLALAGLGAASLLLFRRRK